MNTGIYEIVNTANDHRYVGSASDFAKRWKAHRFHLDRGTHHSPHLQSAWTKYGAAAFRFNRLLVCSRPNLLMYEQRALDALAPAYNVARNAGSCLGVKHSAEMRAKLSASKIGNQYTRGYRHTPEAIEKLRAKQTGVPSPTKGKKRDPAAVAATAAAHRGQKRSAETRARIAAKAAGRRWTDESRAKLLATLAAKPPSDRKLARIAAAERGRARPKSAEHRAKIAESLRGRKATPEARANQSAAQLGKKRGPYKARRADQ